jgi:hypothetical protein
MAEDYLAYLETVATNPKGKLVRQAIRAILEHVYNVNCGLELTSSEYEALGSNYEQDALYLITDTGAIFKNGRQY